MKKLLLTAVLAVGAMLTAASDGKAAFSISVSGHSPTFSSGLSGVPGVGGTSEASVFYSPFGGGGTLTINVFAEHTSNSAYNSGFAYLRTEVLFVGGVVAFSEPITITVSQNAYRFSDAPWAHQGFFTSNPNTDLDVTFAATGQSDVVFTDESSNEFSNSAVAIVQPPLATITHTIQFSSLAGDTNIVAYSSVATPLPATAIGMIAGLPLLGFAGYVRRRFTAAA